MNRIAKALPKLGLAFFLGACTTQQVEPRTCQDVTVIGFGNIPIFQRHTPDRDCRIDQQAAVMSSDPNVHVRAAGNRLARRNSEVREAIDAENRQPQRPLGPRALLCTTVATVREGGIIGSCEEVEAPPAAQPAPFPGS